MFEKITIIILLIWYVKLNCDLYFVYIQTL